MNKQDVINQQEKLRDIFSGKLDSKEAEVAALAVESYLRTIGYWKDKIHEANYHIEKNQEKIDKLYEKLK